MFLHDEYVIQLHIQFDALCCSILGMNENIQSVIYWDSCGSRLIPNVHFLSVMLKTEEADDAEVIAKKRNIAVITLAFTSRS